MLGICDKKLKKMKKIRRGFGWSYSAEAFPAYGPFHLRPSAWQLAHCIDE